MVYKKYIKRGNKRFGPYYYESYRDKDGKVRTRYIGETIYCKSSKKGLDKVKTKHLIGILLLLIIGILLVRVLPLLEDSERTIGIKGGLRDLEKTGFSEEARAPIVGLAVSGETPVEMSTKKIEVKTKRYSVVINRPVKWVKTVKVDDKTDIENLTLEIPKEAEFINIKTAEEVQEVLENITDYNKEIKQLDKRDLKQGEVSLAALKTRTSLVLKIVNWVKDSRAKIVGYVLEEWEIEEGIKKTKDETVIELGRVVELEKQVEDILEKQAEAEIAVEYLTEGPQSVEEELPNGKRIRITAADEFEYKDILAYTELDNSISMQDVEKAKLYWYISEEDLKLIEEIPKTLEEVSNFEETEEIDVEFVKEREEIIGETKEIEEVVTISEENITEEIVEQPTSLENTSEETEIPTLGPLNKLVEWTKWIYGPEIVGSATAQETELEKKLIKVPVEFEAYDLDEDGNVDYIEWIVPYLSEQVYEFVIEIAKAEHLDENKNFIADIYSVVSEKDNVWGTVGNNEYLRIIFEQPLKSKDDITVYMKAGQPAEIEVYEGNTEELIAVFESIQEENLYKVYLTNLREESYYIFDLKIKGEVEFDSVYGTVWKEVCDEKEICVYESEKEGIKAEIGNKDREDKEYEPHLKLSKWNNEVLFKIKPDSENSISKITGSVVSEKIKEIRWDKPKIKGEDSVDMSSELKEVEWHYEEIGDFPVLKMDEIIKQKPDTNIFSYKIESENLDYYYQLPLYLEYGLTEPNSTCNATNCQGAYRPVNVVGSYAVYHKTKANNEYKTGKAFHIYRPKIYEKNNENNWIWGDLNIDEEQGILTITIEQNWLDNADYPIVIDPVFGYQTVGGSMAKLSTYQGEEYGNTPRGSLFTMPEIGWVDSISAYIHMYSNDLGHAGAIYKHFDSSKVGQTETVLLLGDSTVSWRTFNFNPPASVSNIDYVLVVHQWTGGYYTNLYYDSGTTNQGHYRDAEHAESLPSPLSFIHDNKKCSIYATYTIPDIIPPIISIVSIGGDSSSPYSTSDNTPLAVITTNENADCRASRDGDESYDSMSDDVDCSGDGGKSHNCQFGLLSDGSPTVYFACRDTIGNKNTASNNKQTAVQIDTNPPTQSNHNPAKGSTINTKSPTITFTTNELGDCRASLLDESYDSMSNDVDCTSGTSTSHSCSMSGLSEGSEVVYIACKDDTSVSPNKDTVASNEHVNYIVDAVAPIVTINSIGGDTSPPFNISDISPSVSATTNENADCRASNDGDESYDSMSDDVDCSGDGGTSHTCNFGIIGAGTHIISVSCRDSVGNKNTAGDNDNEQVEIDNSAPIVTINSIGGDTSPPFNISDISPSVSATTNENADCRASLLDESYDSMSDDVDCSGDGGTSHTCNFGIIGAGTHIISVSCRDSVGNKNTAGNNDNEQVEIDNSVPTQLNHNPAKGSTISTKSPTITFNTNEIGDCRASLSDESYDNMSNDVDCTSGASTSHSCSMSGLSEGSEVVYIACEDDTSVSPNKDTAASNEHVNYIIDTSAPAVQFVFPTTQSGSYSQNYIKANVTANDPSLADITVYLYFQFGLLQSSSINSPLFVEFTPLSEGTYYLNATAIDTLGNRGSSETRTIILDRSDPTITLISPVNGDVRTTPLFNFAADFNDRALKNATLYVWDSSRNIVNITTTALSGTSDSASIPVTLPYEDTFYWNYYACDDLGNCRFSNVNWSVTYVTIKIGLDVIWPPGNVDVSQNQLFNVTLKVSCSGADCGDVDVSLDPDVKLQIENLEDVFFGSSLGDQYSAVKFDIGSVPQNMVIENAFLALYVSETGSGLDSDVKYYRINNQGWTEGNTAGAMWNLRNSRDTGKTDNSAFSSTGWTYLDVTEAVRKEYESGNKNVSFWLEDPDNAADVPTNSYGGEDYLRIGKGVSNFFHRFYSKEHTGVSNRPYLNIIYRKGLIPTTPSVPFYTIYNNPIRISLFAGDTKLVIFWVNATGSGTWNFFAYVNKTNAMSISNITSFWNVTIIDVTNPTIKLTSPINGEQIQSSPVNFKANFYDAGLKNATLYIWDSNGINYTQTIALSGTSDSASIPVILGDGNYKWNYQACDVGDNCISNNINWTFSLDATPPEVNLLSPPDNLTITSQQTFSFEANFTDINLKNATLFIWDSTNSIVHKQTDTFLGNYGYSNISVTLPDSGTFYWNYYACDGLGNCRFSNVNWSLILGSVPITNTPVLTNVNPQLGPSSDLNCSFVITDSNPSDPLAANVRWYRNGVEESAVNVNVQNGVMHSVILDSNYINAWENWTCSVIPYDGSAFGILKNSNHVFIKALLDIQYSSSKQDLGTIINYSISANLINKHTAQLETGDILIEVSNSSGVQAAGICVSSSSCFRSWFVPISLGYGIYLVNITGSNKTHYLSKSVSFSDSISLWSWNVNPSSLDKIKAIGSQGILEIIDVNNMGSEIMDFNILSNNPSIIWPDVSFLQVPPDQKNSFTLNYSAPAKGTYSINVSVRNQEVTAVPRELNVIINFTSADLKVNLISPTNQIPLTNVSIAQKVEIITNASYEGAPIINDSTWIIKIGGRDCGDITYFYDFINAYWNISCSAPDVPDDRPHPLEAVMLSNEYGEVSYSEDDVVYYRDTSPPVFENIFRNNININGLINLIANVSDNLGVKYVVANITDPNSSSFECNMTNIGGLWFCNSIILNLAGEYIVDYIASDVSGNTGYAQDWFEVYDRYFWAVSLVDYNSTPVSNVSISLSRPYTGPVLVSNITNAFGKANFYVNKRKYDIRGGISGDEFIVREIDFVNSSNPIYLNFYRYKGELGEVIPLHRFDEISSFGIVSNSTNMDSNLVTLIFNYSSLINNVNSLTNLEIMQCSVWDYAARSCLGVWQALSSSRDIDVKTITGNSTGFSAYFLTENTCGTGGCEPAFGEAVGNCGDCIAGGGGPSGGGGGGGGGGSISRSQVTQITESLIKVGGVRIDTSSIYEELFPGETTTINIKLTNTLNNFTTLDLSTEGNIMQFISYESDKIDIKGKESRDVLITISIPELTDQGTYEGSLVLSSGNKTGKIPTTIKVLSLEGKLLDVKIQPLNTRVSPGSILKLQRDLVNVGKTIRVSGLFDLQLLEVNTGEIMARNEERFMVETSVSDIKELEIPKKIKEGEYMVKAVAHYSTMDKDMQATSIAHISVAYPFLSRRFLWLPLWFYLLLILMIVFLIGTYSYAKWREFRKKRFKVKVALNKLPQAGPNSGFIGKIAEIGARAFVNLNNLQMHTLIAGGTGSGKTIAAQGIAEEALLHKKSVIVFDPTAQWTGLLRACKDKGMLRRYSYFNMKTKKARGFNGTIKTIHDPYELIDIGKYMNKPGEITVFNLIHLAPKEIDIVISSTIEQIFKLEPEESKSLKNLIIYDEVHRLLPKFGGSGEGFLQLERGAREFRKWGVGLVLISQVLSDFIGEIKANIGTEIQLRTRYEGDLERVNMKYGDDILKSVVKAPIGTGMVVNAEYNNGSPYFIAFRPVLHSTKRLTKPELEKYEKHFEEAEDIEYQINQLRTLGADVLDLELELKLARGKIKTGQFPMADMYLQILRPKLEESWMSVGKKPRHLVKKKISREEIVGGIAKAKEERVKYIKENPEEIIDIGREISKLKKKLAEKKRKGGDKRLISNIDSWIHALKERIKPFKGKINTEDSEVIMKALESVGKEIDKL